MNASKNNGDDVARFFCFVLFFFTVPRYRVCFYGGSVHLDKGDAIWLQRVQAALYANEMLVQPKEGDSARIQVE